MIATYLSRQQALDADPKDTANHFHCKSRATGKHDNVFRY